MGIYWETVFYSDINNKANHVVLASMDRILDENDVKRGYVCKTELLNFYKSKINEESISENSYIVEYIWDTYSSDPSSDSSSETRRLLVK